MLYSALYELVANSSPTGQNATLEQDRSKEGGETAHISNSRVLPVTFSIVYLLALRVSKGDLICGPAPRTRTAL